MSKAFSVNFTILALPCTRYLSGATENSHNVINVMVALKLFSSKRCILLAFADTFDKLNHHRRIHHAKFLAFHGNQLEYNGSQGASKAG